MGTMAEGMMDKNLAIAALLIGSFIEMWAAAGYCDQHGSIQDDCHDEWAWAVALGVISLIFVIVVIILMKCKPDIVDGIVGQIMFCLLFGLWVAGVTVCTFQKPFAPGPSGDGYGDGNFGVAGNGYFATWACVVFSFILVIMGCPPVTGLFEKAMGSLDDVKKMLLGVFVASIVEMWHAARICDKSTAREGMLAWGVAAGAGSSGLIIIWVLLAHFVPSVAAFTKWFALFLALWWLSAVCSLTMPNDSHDCGDDFYCRGLFTDASNGFFGTWVAMIFAIALACAQFGLELPGGGGGGGGGDGGDGGHSSHCHDAGVTTNPTHEKNEPSGANPAIG